MRLSPQRRCLAWKGNRRCRLPLRLLPCCCARLLAGLLSDWRARAVAIPGALIGVYGAHLALTQGLANGAGIVAFGVALLIVIISLVIAWLARGRRSPPSRSAAARKAARAAALEDAAPYSS